MVANAHRSQGRFLAPVSPAGEIRHPRRSLSGATADRSPFMVRPCSLATLPGTLYGDGFQGSCNLPRDDRSRHGTQASAKQSAISESVLEKPSLSRAAEVSVQQNPGALRSVASLRRSHGHRLSALQTPSEESDAIASRHRLGHPSGGCGTTVVGRRPGGQPETLPCRRKCRGAGGRNGFHWLRPTARVRGLVGR